MATGKERGYKDWKLSKEFKRSARNYFETDVMPARKPRPKNVKKWCKKKVGRLHKYEKTGTTFFWAGYFPWQTRDEWRISYKCTDCGHTKIENIFREVPVD